MHAIKPCLKIKSIDEIKSIGSPHSRKMVEARSLSRQSSGELQTKGMLQ